MDGVPFTALRRAARRPVQSALGTVFPPQCVGCRALVESDFALCGACWRETPFIGGLVCESCGTPLPGTEAEDEAVLCDSCLAHPRPWVAGRAALRYEGIARRLVLGLKHGDRQDLARPLGDWMHAAGRPLFTPDTLLAPVPLHRWRLFKRRYNQSALLAWRIGRRAGLEVCPDLLHRPRRTPSQGGLDHAGRFANMAAALVPHPRRGHRLVGRHVVLVDDVLTSGATLEVAARACLDGGARAVSVLVLARVAQDA